MSRGSVTLQRPQIATGDIGPAGVIIDSEIALPGRNRRLFSTTFLQAAGKAEDTPTVLRIVGQQSRENLGGTGEISLQEEGVAQGKADIRIIRTFSAEILQQVAGFVELAPLDEHERQVVAGADQVGCDLQGEAKFTLGAVQVFLAQ